MRSESRKPAAFKAAFGAAFRRRLSTSNFLGRLFSFGAALFFSTQCWAVEPVCFSPGSCCKDNIQYLIRNAKSKIKIAVNHFADEEILEEIRSAVKRGVEVMVVTDPRSFSSAESMAYALSYAGAMVKMPSSNFEGNRFAVFDDQVIITGSYSWTEADSVMYSSNCLVLEDKSIVKRYSRRFDFLWEIYQK